MPASSEPLQTNVARDWFDGMEKVIAWLPLLIGAGVYFLLSGNWQFLLLVGLGLMVYGITLTPAAHQFLESKAGRFLEWPAISNSTEFSGWIQNHRPVIVALVVIGVLGFLAREVEFAGVMLSIGSYGLLALAIGGVISALSAAAEFRKTQFYRSGIALLLGCAAWLVCPPAYASIHPIFRTPVTRVSVNRPAVQVFVTDDTELRGLDTAELYLSVQSSRFPNGVQVLLPINRGDFRGCKQRFIQLPFEVEVGDNLSFELIDDNQLTPDQERTILLACRAGGYCVQLGNTILAPELDWIVAPTASGVSEAISSATIMSFDGNPFRNFGTGTFIVESSRPTTPSEANPITLLDESNYSRAYVKVYYPVQSLTGK